MRWYPIWVGSRSSARAREHEPVSIVKTLKSYVWWTYERGTMHYDVMVTLILAFIFLTPRWIQYGDQPKPNFPANQIRASVSRSGGAVYELSPELVHAPKSGPSAGDFARAIAPVAGPVTIDRWEAEREGGRVIAWRVWAHRPS